MVSFYNYRTYTEFLHNISVQHATYEIIVHNIWFHFNTKHGHMLFILLYICCATFIHKLSVGTTYSIVLPHTSFQRNIFVTQLVETYQQESRYPSL